MSGNKEQIDVSLIGNDKIEEAIVNIQKEPTEENLVRALSIVRHRMNDKGQLIIAVEPPLPDGKLNLKVIKTEDGQMWWIAYTSFDEELKGAMKDNCFDLDCAIMDFASASQKQGFMGGFEIARRLFLGGNL